MGKSLGGWMTLSLCEITGAVETGGKREKRKETSGRRSLLKGS